MVSFLFSNETDTAFVEADFAGLVSETCAALFLHPDTEVSLTIVDEETISSLNGEWMGSSGPTDVLSFPMDELSVGTAEALSGPGMLGDIVLCPEYAKRQADLGGHSVLTECRMLTVHGILHLLGFDHATPSEETEMFGLQNSLFSDWAARHDQPWTAHFGQSTVIEREEQSS